VFSSRSKTARWTSRTPFRKAFVKAWPPMTEETMDWISGRAAIRSLAFLSTSSSVTRSATNDRTLPSCSATVARLANWSELVAARCT
jgi:hypothetical protein